MTIPSPPRSFPAGEREAIVRCPPCGQPIVMGELVAACPACGTVHHTGCWTQNGGCGTYACAPARRANLEATSNAASSGGVMRVTADDIARAPLPTTGVAPAAQHGASLSRAAWSAEKNVGRDWNRTCIVAFVVALVSIPAFGMFTGWLAVLIGVVGLVVRKPRERGLGLGAGGILIGAVSAIVWTSFYIPKWRDSEGVVLPSLESHEIDPEALADLPEKIARPMRSNVLISTGSTFAGMASVGSGVVLKVSPGSALVLTNRHVVDADFDGRGQAGDALPTGDCRVKFLGKPRAKASVVWIAPSGIDAALVQVALGDTGDVVAACWDAAPHCRIADRVFVVGNPMGLGWSHASGEVSQMRRESFGTHDMRIIQISAPVNHGHSGGGLYDDDGLLFGINTWTQDKSSAEGLSFSIAFHSILPLIPKSFEIPASRAPKSAPAIEGATGNGPTPVAPKSSSPQSSASKPREPS